MLYLVERFCKAWEDEKMSIVSIGSRRHRAPASLGHCVDSAETPTSLLVGEKGFLLCPGISFKTSSLTSTEKSPDFVARV